MKTTKQETAAQAYDRNLKDLLTKLDAVKEHLYKTEVNPNEVHWGHTGSMVHLGELVDRLASAMGMTEYYEGKPVPAEA